MKQHFIANALFILLLHPFIINGMHEIKLTKKTAPLEKNNETTLVLKKKKKNGKELFFLHTTNNFTHEQSWACYKKNYFNGYVTYYKFDPETARIKYKIFSKDHSQEML